MRIIFALVLALSAGCTLVANPDPYYPYPVQRYIYVSPPYGAYGWYRWWGGSGCKEGYSHHGHGSHYGYSRSSSRRHR